MKIIFSRKGFDSGAGGGPSPIVKGAPISLPIPDTKGISQTTYGELGLAGMAFRASRKKLNADSKCHHDPMFCADGTAILGQCGTSQSHLANQGVDSGDLFLFFGLFEGEGQPPHHRIFAYLQIEEIIALREASEDTLDRFRKVKHPHALGMHGRNDTLYVGAGKHAGSTPSELRLTAGEGPVTLWRRPPWLERGGITYFPDRDENWPAPHLMYRVGNGQEFVANIGDRKAPREWAQAIIALIED